MRAFLARRLLLLIPTVLGTVTLVFLLIHLIPGDPVDLMLGETAQAADRVALRQALHLDEPLGRQYLRYVGGVVRGDLGFSIHVRRPVTHLILDRYPATLLLTLAAVVVAVALAVPLGAAAAVRYRTVVDALSTVFALSGLAMPNFLLGPLLIILFALKLDLFPVAGYEGWSSLVLPALTLGLGMSALLTRMTRAALLEALHQDYLTTARAKGLPGRMILWKHVLKNALIPIITVVGLQLGALLAGSIITETIFAWPGVGRLTLQAIQARDYPLVQGCILTIALTYVFVNLAVDCFYAWADPRMRLGRDA